MTSTDKQRKARKNKKSEQKQGKARRARKVITLLNIFHEFLSVSLCLLFGRAEETLSSSPMPCRRLSGSFPDWSSLRPCAYECSSLLLCLFGFADFLCFVEFCMFPCFLFTFCLLFLAVVPFSLVLTFPAGLTFHPLTIKMYM